MGSKTTTGSLAHVDIGLDFNPQQTGEYEAGVPNIAKRKPERTGLSRAAKVSDIEARLYAIGRSAAMDFRAAR